MTDQAHPEASQSMRLLFHIIDSAGAGGVSDIHVKPDEGVYFVKSGVPQKDPNEKAIVHQDTVLAWLVEGVPGNRTPDDILGTRGHTSIAYDTGRFRVRASFRRDMTGVSVTFRIIPYTMPNADALGLPAVVQDLMQKKSGLILFEGPTGSGKTTCIAALGNKVNHEQDRHLYLIEDPTEFVHTPVGSSVITQREIGVHASDYTTAVENALRSKPDIIVVGELLDNQTKKAALHAATTGHLVMTTAHAGSVVEAIESFIGEFEAREQPQVRSRLSQSLLAVIVQQLVPTVRGGLTAVREIAIIDENVQSIIREGELFMLHSQLESNPHATSLDQSLAELVAAGSITRETAFQYTRKPDALTQNLRRFGDPR